MADRLAHDLEHGKMTASEVAKLTAARRSLLDKIGLLTGEGQVTESQILKSPAWERLVKAMVEALRPYPDAARAVTDALARVVGDHGQEKPRKRSSRGD